MPESSDTLVLEIKSAGRMPATVPFAGPKKRTDESPRGKEDPNSLAGGAGWSVTGRSRWLERPNTGAQDVVMTHEDQQTARSPTTFCSIYGNRSSSTPQPDVWMVVK